MSLRKTSTLLAVASATLLPAVAMAHPGHGMESGLEQGLLHPLTGLDHLLAMIAVALLAVRLGGRARWSIPAAFIACGAAGGVIAMSGATVPLVETMIVASVLIGGILLYRGEAAPMFAVAAVPLFGFFHGYAHLSELPASAETLSYSVGLLLASAALIGGLMLVATFAQRRCSERWAARTCRIVGGGMAVAALMMMLA